MASSVKKDLGRALRLLLKPLVKLLISQGMTHADFSEAAKDVFVEMAIRSSDGNKVNKAKIAIVTGLTRKEVANVVARLANTDSESREFSRPSKVLSGWHNDPEYQGPYGVPLEIPYEHPTEGMSPSFTHLVRVYSGDMTPKAMLEELVRVGAVVRLTDKEDNLLLKVVRRDFEPEALSTKLIDRFGDVAYNFLTTVAANVEKQTAGSGPFDRVVFSDFPMTRIELQEFDKYLKNEGFEFLQKIDIWCNANIKDKDAFPTDEETFNTGVAMVQYIEWDPSEKEAFHQFLAGVVDGKTR